MRTSTAFTAVHRQPRVAIFRERVGEPSQGWLRDQFVAFDEWEPMLFCCEMSETFAPVHSWSMADHVSKWRIDLFRLTRRQRHLSSALAEFDPDIVVAHFGEDALLIRSITKRLGIPTIGYFHGYDVNRKFWRTTGLAPRFRVYVLRRPRLLRQLDGVVAVSAYLQQKLISMGAPPSRSHVGYLGIPTSTTPQVVDVHDTLEERSMQVTFVGRLAENKGVDTLLHALALTKAEGLDLPLLVAGDGPDRADLEHLAKNLGIRATFLGYLPKAEVTSLLASSAIACFPSRDIERGDNEGFGLVSLEAQLVGTPVVVSSAGGLPESVLDGITGTVVAPDNAEELAAAISATVTNPTLWAQLSSAARNHVKTSFDVKQRTRDLEGLLAAATTGSTPRAR